MNLKGRSFLTLLDFNKDEIRYMLDLAHELKAKKKKGIQGEELKGKNIVLVFDKSSTRTRCSFEVAAMDEGAHVTYLTNSHMNKKAPRSSKNWNEDLFRPPHLPDELLSIKPRKLKLNHHRNKIH